jgi:predicted RNA-binding Zn-ribbon protein involved in translation (DUF1610 family)
LVKQGTVGEAKHTSGHDVSVVIVNANSFMCPECGKLFTIKEAAEAHLHGVHLEHLRKEHNEFHNKDVVGHHVE